MVAQNAPCVATVGRLPDAAACPAMDLHLLHLLHLPFLATRGRLGRQAIGFTYPTWQHVAGWVGKVGEVGNGSMTSSWQQEADWVGKVGEVGNGVRRRRAAGNTRQTG